MNTKTPLAGVSALKGAITDPFSDAETRSGTVTILLIGAFFMAFLVWASLAELEEVARGDGRVIPSQKTQIIQSSEPGVIAELFVRPGQRIAKGDLLIRLDKTPTSASLGEVEAKVRSLTAQLTRLQLENEGRIDVDYPCPEQIKERAPAVCIAETELFRARRDNLKSRIRVFEEKAEQKRRELAEAESNVRRFTDTVALAKRELELIQPLASRKMIADLELIRAQRSASEAEGQLRSALELKARAEAGVRESELQIEEQKLIFRQAAMTEMTEKRGELSIAEETTKGAAERLRRTDIRSPVEGVVNELYFNTQGAFVNPGDRVLSIVPLEDTLLIEARIRPSDIAFIHSGQKSVVKVTALDYSIFGGLDGIVETVAADTVLDQTTKEPFYTVVVRTNETRLKSKGGEHQIMPGMVCSVDIITGRKTIMQYLLKPINRARENALRER
jgi:adhesin transport system membrane fusion protein